MKVRADVKCLTCGFISGQVEGEVVGDAKSRVKPERAIRSALCPAPWPVYGKPLRCGRCGGPVFLDEIETIKPPRRVITDKLAA